ncbi:MAG: RluA family pseudouridine synthase [Eubacteriales bacterium]|nr:RluA family pseudouridine synthase [Eubacteriales bacterium]
MSSELNLTVKAENAGVRIDKFISENADGITRSATAKLIEDGNVTVDGKEISKNYKCKENDEITVFIPDAKPLEARAENIPLDIVYEDSDLLVVNKPKGMVVHPAAGNYDGTLVNALLYHCDGSLSGINGVIRPGIVHRIDKDTSGLLIVAKNDFAHIHLAEQIKDHSFHRAYQAVVYGNIREDSGTVNQPIGRNPNDRKKMAVTLKNSKNATTHYEVINRFGDFTHIRCILETGRTHQIRVHMAYIGHPLAGDMVYGPKKVIKSLEGQCLHAGEIGFVHPRTGEYMEFKSELPDYFKTFLARLDGSRK